MKWLIQKNIGQFLPVKWALEDMGEEVYVAMKIPFSDEGMEIEDPQGNKITAQELFAQFPDVIPYGSTSFVMELMPLKPKNLFFKDPDNFKTSTLVSMRKDMLNSHCVVKKFKDLGDMTYSSVSPTWFIKPNNDLKIFAGAVLDSEEISKWVDQIKGLRNEGQVEELLETEVVLAPYREIHSEYRCFVIDRKVVDASMYRSHGFLRKEAVVDPTVLEYFQTFVDNTWIPDTNVVMDLCKISFPVGSSDMTRDEYDEKPFWAVVEFNCLNCSGFYANNVTHILTKLREACS